MSGFLLRFRGNKADELSVENVTGTWGGKSGAFVIDDPALVLTDEAKAIRDEWRELCRWDPALPPNADPPLATEMVSAVLSALGRPQPLGWGPDPEIRDLADRFASEAGGVDVVVGMLICLREATTRQLEKRLEGADLVEAARRMQMVVDRAIGVAASRSARGLEERAYNDPLTGLANRWGLERDIARELGRADRHSHHMAVVAVDLDGLKWVNDTEGHAAGDKTLCALADAMRSSLRRGDAAYRIGGDEFVMILTETDSVRDTLAPDMVVKRMEAAGAPPFSWGAATYPNDGRTAEQLLRAADQRLLDSREARGYRQH